MTAAHSIRPDCENARLLDPAYDDVQPSSSRPHRCTCGGARESTDSVRVEPKRHILTTAFLGLTSVKSSEPSSPMYGHIRLRNGENRKEGRFARFNKAAVQSGLPHTWAFFRLAQGALSFTMFVMFLTKSHRHKCYPSDGVQVGWALLTLLISVYAFITLAFRRIRPRGIANWIPFMFVADIFWIVMLFLVRFRFHNSCERHYRIVHNTLAITATDITLFFVTTLILFIVICRKRESVLDQIIAAFYSAGDAGTAMAAEYREIKEKLRQRRLRRQKLHELAQGLLDGTIQIVQVSRPQPAIPAHAPPSPEQAPLFVPTPVPASEAGSSRSAMAMAPGAHVMTPTSSVAPSTCCGGCSHGHSQRATMVDGLPPAYDATSGEPVIPVAGAPLAPVQRLEQDIKSSATEFLLAVESGSTTNPYNSRNE